MADKRKRHNAADEMTPEAAAAYVDRLAASGKVTHFFMCPSGQRTSYASEVWDRIWDEYDPEKENNFKPALANRIDRNTGGIVIACKNAEALRIICQKIILLIIQC